MVYFKTIQFRSVKKIFLVSLSLCCGLGAFSETYADFIVKVLNASPVYQSALLEYHNTALMLLPYKYRWLPQPILDVGYGSSVNKKIQNFSLPHLFKTSLILLQDIPGGISVQAQAEQFFALNKNTAGSNDYKNAYEFSASFALSMPLYSMASDTSGFVAEGQRIGYDLNEDIRALELKIAKKQITVEAVLAVSNCLILKERIALEERRQELQKKDAAADERLWLLGRLSSFELGERNTKRFESYVALLQMKQNLANLVENLYVFGLDETSLPSDVDSWIIYWEKYTAENQSQNALTYILENKKQKRNFFSEVEKHLAAVPKLQFSASAESASGQKIFDCWQSGNHWDLNFTLAVRFPLSPVSQEYCQNAFSVNAWHLYDVSEKQLFNRRETEENQYRTTIGLLKKLSEKALRNKIDSDNKIIKAQVLTEQGYLSQIDFEYQKLNAALSENTYKQVRLHCVVALLRGY